MRPGADGQKAGEGSAPPYSPSLRRRLITQLLGLSAILAIALFFAVRISSEQASEATLDGILGAATTAIAEELRSVDGGPLVELPSGTFSILSAMGEERIFYRIMIGGRDLTGYEDLPEPEKAPSSLEPVFYTASYRDAELRIAAVARNLVIDEGPVRLLVMVGQTREAQNTIAARLANRAAALGLAVFLAAIPLSLLAASRLLRPIEKLAAAMERRGPRDLRPVRHPAPAELVPLISALNSFITRLRGTLAQTETFIAEAAHHIRTP
ncbi:sensor histidine kinase N-terminal domain-containing protein [Pannonibacter phragmitetus]|uniref:sensor histidine kinase N-terminal domain-containing protein n=1 Tax=Pannonibacter phragmitetus TaxID=121719 RepID=UPI003D2EB3EE